MSKQQHQIPQELHELQNRIEQWRQNRPRLGPMPEELWREAAQLASRLTPSIVAGHLRLGYVALKNRMFDKNKELTGSRDKKVVRSGVHFIEYRQEEMDQSKPHKATDTESVLVELTDPSGYRLGVQVPLLHADCIATCLKQVWELRTCCR